MLSLRNYTACSQIDLHQYYNVSGDLLLCGFCRKKNKSVPLHSYLLSDGLTRWYVCAHCGFAGTGIEYLAHLNDTETGQQIQELVRKKKIPPVEQEQIQKFRQFRESWTNLKKQFTAAAPFRRETTFVFADMYDLDYCPLTKNFRQGARQTFERWFQPGLKNKQHCTSGSRLFHGRWCKITAIPLYDMPLHLSGILFVNGHEQGKQKYIIRRLSAVQSPHTSDKKAAGL